MFKVLYTEDFKKLMEDVDKIIAESDKNSFKNNNYSIEDGPYAYMYNKKLHQHKYYLAGLEKKDIKILIDEKNHIIRIDTNNKNSRNLIENSYDEHYKPYKAEMKNGLLTISTEEVKEAVDFTLEIE